MRDKLLAPFPENEIEWRIQQSGKKDDKIWALVIPYVTNRAIMKRLDDLFGIEGWSNELKAFDGGFISGITIKGITKYDGADKTDIEPAKGGISNAMKRAAVQWGIGRYLYKLDVGFADISEKGTHKAKTKDGTFFRWNPPKLPDWALPVKNPDAEFEKAMDDEFVRVGSKAFNNALKGTGYKNVSEIKKRGEREGFYKILKSLKTEAK